MSETSDASASRSNELAEIREARKTTVPFDPELVRLVNFMNIVDTAEIGLTLHVGGCVVSGMLISMAQFYRLLVKDFTDMNRLTEHSDRDVAASFAKFYSFPLENAEKALDEYRESQKLPPLPRHIHLRYAQTLIPGGQPVTQALWRGRLAGVDGWSIGNFGPIPPLSQLDSEPTVADENDVEA